MTVLAVVQARTGSTRLPGKVLKEVCGRPLIEFLLTRLARARLIDEIVLATTSEESDDKLADVVTGLGHRVVRGSTSDVLARFANVLELYPAADLIVRITGDCPFVDPDLVDAIVRRAIDSSADYTSNVAPPTFPDGLDVEVIARRALLDAVNLGTDPRDREHVTPFIRRAENFTKENVENDVDLSGLRWTVDEFQDLEFIIRVLEHLDCSDKFGWKDVLRVLQYNPNLQDINGGIVRNEGFLTGTGQKLWSRAKRVIPGGNMLLSKRSEMFLPENWPSYFSRSSGCRVWDLDGREYRDMGLMGVGTNVLGYAHPEVDDAVRRTIDRGVMSTLNCPEEVELAERLVEMHPWAQMVRLARSGGEANAVAVRIARAATGRDKVAICGYHGWHDWYLSANLADEQGLDGHLLPGLEPNGVPRTLVGTVMPVVYGDTESVATICHRGDVAAFVMEVSRSTEPDAKFLAFVREETQRAGIVLMFDECTSGFRETFGGLHLKVGISPDMAMFGKALGNGYAITAVVGKQEVMQSAQTSFISSTFWTERIGPSAAVKTLEVMERENSWTAITAIGLAVRSAWSDLAEEAGLDLSIGGLPALSTMTFGGEKSLELKTFMTQEMLRRGFLATTAFYASIAHREQDVADYLANLREVFQVLGECQRGERSIAEMLDGPVCHSGFKRLN